MDEDELKGKFHNAKGRVKEAGGALTGDQGKQAEGVVERIGGSVQEKIGEAKRKLREETEEESDDEL
jgi:uncharacterized protein YjbJ (UPF0337 family)